MRQYSGWFAFVLLLGCVIGFAAGKFDTVAQAQGVDNKTTRWLAGTVSYGQAQDAFLLFDSQTNRLACYTMSPMKELELIAVREISYDVKLSSYGRQKPSAQQIREEWERFEKEERERKEKEKDKDK